MNRLDSNRIEAVLGQKDKIIKSTPPRKIPISSKIASVVGRKSIANAQAEVMREVLAKLISIVYEITEDGRYWNIARDGRIDGVTMPWGINYSDWGVKRTHARVLQYTMVRASSPFIYIENSRRWYLDLENYPTKEHAYYWLQNFNLSGEMWISLMDRWRNR